MGPPPLTSWRRQTVRPLSSSQRHRYLSWYHSFSWRTKKPPPPPHLQVEGRTGWLWRIPYYHVQKGRTDWPYTFHDGFFQKTKMRSWKDHKTDPLVWKKPRKVSYCLSCRFYLGRSRGTLLIRPLLVLWSLEGWNSEEFRTGGTFQTEEEGVQSLCTLSVILLVFRLLSLIPLQMRWLK